MFVAFPPVGLSAFGWLAPIALIELVRRKQSWTRADYFAVWIGSLLQWLVLLYGIRIAHIWLNAGWLLLSGYLACYNVAFVGLSRVARQRLRISLLVACPVIWVGLEYARGFLVTGFSLALLAHSQVHWTSLLQVADLFGAYAVSYVMMTVAVAMLLAWHHRREFKKALIPVFIASALFAGVLGYGFYRLGEAPPDQARKATIALLQGSMDTIFEDNPTRDLEMFWQYRDQTFQLAASGQPLDLIVWPESSFILPEIHFDEANLPSDDAEERKIAIENQDKFNQIRLWLASHVAELYRASTNQSEFSPQLIIGTQSAVYAKRRRIYNAAMLLDRQGEIVQRYFKMHPVLFGEVLPFGNLLPFLYDLSPMSMGMSVGEQPLNFKVGDIRLCPNICFEITVPHLIRRQFLQVAEDRRPDAFINLTNDGWFWGSSILDFQFAGAVFRAIENRCPVLVAANCGITAHIDGAGRIVERLPRQQMKIIVARLSADGRSPAYHLWGDWPAAFCLGFTVLLGIVAVRWPFRAV